MVDTIRSKEIDIRFIRKDNILPVLDSPVFINFCPSVSFLTHFCIHKRFFCGMFSYKSGIYLFPMHKRLVYFLLLLLPDVCRRFNSVLTTHPLNHPVFSRRRFYRSVGSFLLLSLKNWQQIIFWILIYQQFDVRTISAAIKRQFFP